MKTARKLGVIWGVVGITALIGSAIIRLLSNVFEGINAGLSPSEWTALALWCVFMFITEGYQGFQKKFSPRFAARAWHLINHGRPLDIILAPLYCIGYFHAVKKRIITSWALTVSIILLVMIVRYTPQPWRGIIDSGIILGLAYGLIWIYICLVKTLRKRCYIVDPEVINLN